MKKAKREHYFIIIFFTVLGTLILYDYYSNNSLLLNFFCKHPYIFKYLLAFIAILFLAGIIILWIYKKINKNFNIKKFLKQYFRFSYINKYSENNSFYEALNNIAFLLKRNVGLIEAIETIKTNCSSQKLKTLFNKIIICLSQGSSFSQAIKKNNIIFSNNNLLLIEVCEKNGALDKILLMLSQRFRKNNEIKYLLRFMFTYPAIMINVCIGVCFFLLEFTLPAFIELFKETNTPLPEITKRMLFVSSFIKDHMFYIILILIFMPIIFRLIIKHFGENLPFIKNSIFIRNEFDFLILLEISIKMNVPLHSILKNYALSIQKPYIKKQILILCDKLNNGQNLSDSIKHIKFISPVSRWFITTAENTQALLNNLKKLLLYKENTIRKRAEVLAHFSEPLFIIFNSLIAALIILSLYLPIFNIIDTVK